MNTPELRIHPVEGKPVIENIESRIKSIMQDVAMLGANDFEISTIKGLLERIADKTCTPEFALQQAQMILNNKQADH